MLNVSVHPLLKNGRIREVAQESYRAQFEAAMDDDFNTADAISAIFELVKWINSHVSGSSSKEFLETLDKELLDLTGVCGMIVERDNTLEDDLAAYVEAKIEERKAAKKARDKNDK